MLYDVIEFNEKFVENKEYEVFTTSKYPEKKLAIVACMDSRLVELMPAALGLKNGDVKIIKNAGGVITHPFGSVVRSLLIAIMDLGVTQIMVIGHTDCGVQGIDGDNLVERLIARGISKHDIELVRYCNIDYKAWLGGFDCVEKSTASSVKLLKEHPLIPKDVEIKGYIMDSETGKLTPVE